MSQKCCCFEVGNLTALETIGILMDVDPEFSWAALYQSKQERDFVSKLTKNDFSETKMFHGTFRWNVCTLNDGGKFQKSYKEIYSKKLELKLKHSRYHATFLDFNITISNCKISIKLYDKCDDFSSFTVHMPNFHSYIPSSHGPVMSKILRIAKSSSSVISSYEKATALITKWKSKAEIDENV